MAHVVGELEAMRSVFAKHTREVNVDTTAVIDRLSNLYTMHEERSVLGTNDSALNEGDVELF